MEGKFWETVKGWLSKFWIWSKKNSGLFFKILVAIGGAIFLISMAKAISNKIRKAILGNVAVSDNWMRIPGRDDVILIKDDKTGKFDTVELPKGVKAKDVAAAAILPGGIVNVQIMHTPIDRKSASSV